MAAVDRELEITYGTFVIGGTTDVDGQERLIDQFITIDRSFTDLTVTFEFVISKTTEALFEDEILAVEDAFREPFLDFSIVQGTETILDCKPSTGTGLLTQPQLTKGDDANFQTGRSRKYQVVMTAQIPADKSPTVGIRESTITASFAPSRRRTTTISGVVTQIGVVKARAEYEAIIDTYCTAVLTTLTGTWELGEEPTVEVEFDNQSGTTGGSTCAFQRIFDELIFEQAPGVADNVKIVRQDVIVTRNQVGPGDTAGKGARRLIEMSATYEAWIDHDEDTDIRGVWDEIRSWVYDQIRETLDASVLAITSSAPVFDYDNQRITVAISGLGSTGANIIEHRETTQMADVFGVVLVPAWEAEYSKYSYQGPATRRRTTTVTQRTLGGGGAAGAAQPQNVPRNLNAPGGQGFQFGLPGFGGGGNPAGIGSLGAIGSQNSIFNQSFGFGQVSRQGFSFGVGGGGGGGQAGKPSPAAQLLQQQLTFIPISLTVSETPLTLGTDGEVFNVTDVTTVLVEDGFIPISGGAGRPSTGGPSGGGPTRQR